MTRPESQKQQRQPASGSGAVVSLLGGVLLLVVLAAIGASALLGAAAPIGPGDAGARLAAHALASRDLVRGGGSVLSAPSGMAALGGIALRAFGDAPWVPRAPAIAATLLAALALGLCAWRGWGPWGAVGAAAWFALLPRVAGLGPVPDAEMPVLAASLFVGAAYLRYRSAPSAGAALAICVWTLVSLAADIVAAAFAATLVLATVAAGLAQVRASGGAPGVTGAAQSPLQGVMQKRGGRGLVHFSIVFGVVLALGTLVALAVSALRGGPTPNAGGTLGPRLADLLPGLAWLVVGADAVVLLLRAARRRLVARDAVLIALAVAVAVRLPGFPANGSLLTPAAALVALAAVDLGAQVAALVRRALPGALAALAAGLLVVAGAAALAPVARASLDRVRREGHLAAATSVGPTAAGDRDLLLVAQLLADATSPWDRVLVRESVGAGPAFRLVVDRAVEGVSALAAVRERQVRDRNLVLVFREPLPEAERVLHRALVRDHPAAQLGDLWMVDMRSTAPGIRRYVAMARPLALSREQRFWLYPLAERWHLRRDGWRELELDLAFDVVPALDHRPLVALPAPGDRAGLLAYHNYQNLVGDAAARAQARARLSDGTRAPVEWTDPVPFGLWAGVRWLPEDRALAILWECTGTPPVASDFGLRYALQPLDRKWRGHVDEAPTPVACRGGRKGELREELLRVKFPYKGRFEISVEVTRPGGRGVRRATGSRLVLAEVEHHGT